MDARHAPTSPAARVSRQVIAGRMGVPWASRNTCVRVTPQIATASTAPNAAPAWEASLSDRERRPVHHALGSISSQPGWSEAPAGLSMKQAWAMPPLPSTSAARKRVPPRSTAST
ncbi:hypothetical protein D9M68_704800 [compost metagenome]